MDEVDGLRSKISSEDSLPVSSTLAEPINLEGQQVTVSRDETLMCDAVNISWYFMILSVYSSDPHYARLRGELEFDAHNLEAESWSVAVDQSYLKALNKEAIKRQDVIYGMLKLTITSSVHWTEQV